MTSEDIKNIVLQRMIGKLDLLKDMDLINLKSYDGFFDDIKMIHIYIDELEDAIKDLNDYIAVKEDYIKTIERINSSKNTINFTVGGNK